MYSNQTQTNTTVTNKFNLFGPRSDLQGTHSINSFFVSYESYCEEMIDSMFKITLIPFAHHSNKYISYPLYFIINIIYFAGLFCMLIYPSYYINQPEIWTFDLCFGFIVYNVLIYNYTRSNLFLFDSNNNVVIPFHRLQEELYYESIKITNWKNYISFGFYILFMLYWLYFAIFMLYIHSEPVILIQLGNIMMFFSWYLFFSTTAVLYYYMCVKMIKRHEDADKFLHETKHKKGTITIKNFTEEYFIQYKKTKVFSTKWKLMIYLAFMIQTMHVPVDLFSIIVNDKLYDIPGFIIKLLALIWYIYCMCELNNMDNKIIQYLYKHQVFEIEEIQGIEKFVETRPLGIDFYGFKINGNFIMQVLLILVNFIIPILYGLFTNNFFNR
jgi:hypothetical protein